MKIRPVSTKNAQKAGFNEKSSKAGTISVRDNRESAEKLKVDTLIGRALLMC